MKKIFVFLLLMVLAGNAHAAGLSTIRLKMATNDSVITDYRVFNGVAETTDTVYTNGNTGFNVLIVDVDSGGDVDIYQEVSADGVNWYEPYTTDGSSLTNVRGIATAVTADRWIIPTARVAKYVRFVIDPDANSIVSLKYMYQQEQ